MIEALSPEIRDSVLSNPIAFAADQCESPGARFQMLSVIGRYRGELHWVAIYPESFTPGIAVLFRCASDMTDALRDEVRRIGKKALHDPR